MTGRAWTIAVGLLLAALPASAAGPAAPAAPASDDCLACHDDASLKRGDGRSLAVAAKTFEGSVHGQAGLSCTDCHQDLAATVDFPHAEKLAPVACGTCHDTEASEHAGSAHGKARARDPKSHAASCADCHGTHDILSPKDPASPTNHLKTEATCARCHADSALMQSVGVKDTVVGQFEDSIHGQALSKAGLVVAPTCTSCHGVHDLHGPRDAKSKVGHARVPETCGSCHAGILDHYRQSVHGRAVAAGKHAAVCTDCHTAHDIRLPSAPGWKLEVVKECGTCHRESERTYRDGFHGKAGSLGFTRVATCADCHSAHDILPRSDPRSTVAEGRLVETCQKCHPGANASFATFDPHANPEHADRGSILHWTALFMQFLLAAVAAFFGLHSALWLPRSARNRRLRVVPPPPGPAPPIGKGDA